MAATASHGAQGWILRFGSSAAGAGGGHSHTCSLSSASELRVEARRAWERPEASIGTKKDPLRSYCGVHDPEAERKTDARLEKWPVESSSSHEGYAVPQKGSFGGVP